MSSLNGAVTNDWVKWIPNKTRIVLFCKHKKNIYCANPMTSLNQNIFSFEKKNTAYSWFLAFVILFMLSSDLPSKGNSSLHPL